MAEDLVRELKGGDAVIVRGMGRRHRVIVLDAPDWQNGTFFAQYEDGGRTRLRTCDIVAICAWDASRIRREATLPRTSAESQSYIDGEG